MQYMALIQSKIQPPEEALILSKSVAISRVECTWRPWNVGMRPIKIASKDLWRRSVRPGEGGCVPCLFGSTVNDKEQCGWGNGVQYNCCFPALDANRVLLENRVISVSATDETWLSNNCFQLRVWPAYHTRRGYLPLYRGWDRVVYRKCSFWHLHFVCLDSTWWSNLISWRSSIGYREETRIILKSVWFETHICNLS
jgi:hypothetical protein